MRAHSPLQTILTYATFFALSLAIHVVAILGNRPLPEASADGPAAAVAESAK